jgi:hypothetical protein
VLITGCQIVIFFVDGPLPFPKQITGKNSTDSTASKPNNPPPPGGREEAVAC